MTRPVAGGANDGAGFRSFFQAGFECTTARNRARQRLHLVRSTQHDRFLLDDYRLLKELGIGVVREGISWAHAATGSGRLDLSSLEQVLDASERAGVDVIFDLFHFGYPDDQDPFSPSFADAFADYCFEVARTVWARGRTTACFTPINEPSYLAWAGGEVAMFAPYATGRGWELKVSLARAGIRGIDAIRAAFPGARIVNVDPVCWTVPSTRRREDVRLAKDHNQRITYQSWDLLSGRLLPELGGSAEHLDIVGINYYAINQWAMDAPYVNKTHRIRRPLRQNDPRRRPLRSLIDDVWKRYGREVLISETSHVGRMRAPWLKQVAAEVGAAIDGGVPVLGVCLYPALSMPLWHRASTWLHMGLWDLEQGEAGLARVPVDSYHDALRAVRQEFAARTVG